jgi:hypothetical protein
LENRRADRSCPREVGTSGIGEVVGKCSRKMNMV